MDNRRRIVLGIATLGVLVSFVVLGSRFKGTHVSPPPSPRDIEYAVDSGADRGPGTLREALYAADSASRRATIAIHTSQIKLDSPLPPLVNPHGIRIAGPAEGVDIDAHALGSSPVLDVDADYSTISGLRVHDCAATAVLVRASHFQLTSVEIGACDVGIDVAENANQISVEHSRFVRNRVGIRLAASSRNSVVAGSRFAGHSDSGVWAVRAALDQTSGVAISVHDNIFDGDRIGIVAGNVALVIEHNSFLKSREAGLHLIGSGVLVRANRITGGGAGGVVGEGTHGLVMEANDIDDVPGYAILLRSSGGALIHGNRISRCGFGIGFVLGDPREASSAIDNTLVATTYDGIDVVGDSPTLRRNRIVESRATPLKVQDFHGPDGTVVASHPFLADNMIAASQAAPAPPAAAGNPSNPAPPR